MSYRCPKCGEELIGAVNRCWKCGRAFAAPVTIAPEDEQALKAAAQAEGIATESAGEVFMAQLAESALPPPDAGPIRVGSPFAGAAIKPAATTTGPNQAAPRPKLPSTPIRPIYPQNAAATGAAYSAVFLAVMSLLVCLVAGDGLMLAVAALLIAFLGLVMGAWGLSSRERKVAGIGLLLCVVAVSLSSVWTGLNAFRESRSGQLGESVSSGF